MEVKRKQKFVRLKFGKVKLWSKAPSFYRVHPTHLPSGFGHAVVQRPHSALPNLPQRRTEVYFKYQQLKNQIIFLHTLSYIIHVFHSHELVSKKQIQKERMPWNVRNACRHYHVLPCFAMFGPCFLVARHDADVSLGADVPPTALKKRCKIQGNIGTTQRNRTKISTNHKCSKLARGLGHLLLLPLWSSFPIP